MYILKWSSGPGSLAKKSDVSKSIIEEGVMTEDRVAIYLLLARLYS